jgi:calcineurin-like phosphoesterase family protein
MAAFFISDTHFGHENIIATCNRPFANAGEMDEALIARWNERVRPGDIVYHLGDFSYRNATAADAYLPQLNGEIHLIAGNHDGETLAQHARLFASVSQILEIRAGGQRIVLCHYPMREWHGSWRNAWHFFGHVHGRLNHEPHGFSLDVGADSHDFRPWNLDEIGRLFETRGNPFSDGKRRRASPLDPAPAATQCE